VRTLRVDRAIGDQWVVMTGLNAGDRVIVEGIQSAKPGSKVQPEEYRPPSEKTVRQAGATPPTAAE